MARVTIEDCVASIANRFRLVMCSAQRGRELASGVEPTVERDRLIKHEKHAVIALREITQGNLDVEALEDAIVRNHRRFSPIEAAEEEGSERGVEGDSAVFPAASASAHAVSDFEVLPEIHAEAVFVAEGGGGSAAAEDDGGSAVAEDEGGSAAAEDDGDSVVDGGEVADEEGS